MGEGGVGSIAVEPISRSPKRILRSL